MGRSKGVSVIISEESSVIRPVFCSICGKVHNSNAKSFIKVSGNLFSGEEESLLKKDLQDSNIYFCKNPCFVEFAVKVCELTTGDLANVLTDQVIAARSLRESKFGINLK